MAPTRKLDILEVIWVFFQKSVEMAPKFKFFIVKNNGYYFGTCHGDISKAEYIFIHCMIPQLAIQRLISKENASGTKIHQ